MALLFVGYEPPISGIGVRPGGLDDTWDLLSASSLGPLNGSLAGLGTQGGNAAP